MDRHSLDIVSLIAGLLITAVAVVFLVGAYVDLALDGRLIVPLGLVAAGVIGLVALLSSRRGRSSSP